MLKVCLIKTGISLHMKVSEGHERGQSIADTTHFHAPHHAWVAAVICFTLKLTADDICAMPGIVHKCNN
jgi:hypothetical protein